MQLEFRKGRHGDAETLSAIARESKASWGYPAAWLRAWASSLEVTSAYIEREGVWVATQGNEAAGFYALVRLDGTWLLDHFWVRPACQGQGVGRAMFVHLVDSVRAMGPGVVVIEADPNAAAFYRHMGARDVGEVPAPVEGDPSRSLPVLEVTVDAA